LINVFVYGSLKRGYWNHSLISGYMCTEAKTRDSRFTMVNLGAYPAVLNEGNNYIYGELYRNVSEDVMRNLDDLEGYPFFYNRMKVKLDSNDVAWMYFLEDREQYLEYEVLVSGEWSSN